MKAKLLLILFAMSLCTGMTSCINIRHAKKPHKEIPPGHAKKIKGKKAAKFHAPKHRN